MNPKDFLAPEAGRVIRTPTGYHAFVPNPLPPNISWTDDLVRMLSLADAALSELSGLGTDLAELLIDEAGAGPPRDPDDVREVRNYVTALEYGIKRLRDFPLSLRLVRELHEHLMRGVRGDRATPGEFRRSQNWIGAPGADLKTATYVPPPVDEMMTALGAWEKFIHERGRLPDLIQCALIHEQFEAIHPFLDGNGRVGRLLISLFLVERRRLSQPLLYLSAYIEEHRNDYYDLLQGVRTRGDWSSWLLFFLDGVGKIGKEAVERSSRLLGLRERFGKKVMAYPHALRLVDALMVNPYITVARAQELLKVSNPTARHAVNRLQDAGVLEETTGRSWGKLYLARPIMRAIDVDFHDE